MATPSATATMLDILLFRTDQGGNPDLVRESQRRRYADVTLVDKVIEFDTQWRQSKRQAVSFSLFSIPMSSSALSHGSARRPQ